MNRTIRITALALAVLAFFIFVGSPFEQAAEALVAVAPAVIAILIAGLAAVGITFVTTGSYNTLEDYVESLFIDYATSQGTSTQSLLRGCQSGSNRLGQILLNNKFVVLISTFGAWLISRFSLTNNNTTVVQAAGANLSDLQLYGMPLTIEATSSQYNDVVYEIYTATAPVYLLFGLNGSTMTSNMISNESATVRVYGIKSNGQIDGDRNYYLTYKSEYGLYYAYRNMTYNQYHDFSHITLYNQSDVIAALEGNGDIDINNIGIDIVTGSVVLPLDDDNYTDGDGAVIDLDNNWGTTYSDIIDDVIPGEFSDSKEGSASIEYTSEEEVTDQVEDTGEKSVSNDPEDYESPGLQSVFPFCIPFDIYAFFECLAADPVAPSFEWRFYVPGICDEEITVDLAPFDTVAQIVRTMELLAFIVGLALVTRDKFLRG